MNINVLASLLATAWARLGWTEVTRTVLAQLAEGVRGSVVENSIQWHGWTATLTGTQLRAVRGVEVFEQDIGPRPGIRQAHEEAILFELAGKHPIRVAFSGGKDSSAVLSLVLMAAARRRREGLSVCPIVVSSADTGVESPEVVALRSGFLAAAEGFARDADLDLRVVVSKPLVNEAWWPRILAGRKLPSMPGVKSDCSVDLKIKPTTRATAAIRRELEAAGWPPMVTVMGTRYEESARRAAHMAERGESAVEVVEREGELYLSPIADWTAAEVFDFLADVRAPKIAAPWDELMSFYADSSTECVIVPDAAIGQTAARCGARSGCFVCQMVSRDVGAEALVKKPEYGYLEPLVRLNRYLAATQWDLGRRSWIGHATQGDHAVIAPHCFSFAHTDELMRIVMTLDVQEAERAADHDAKLRAGQIEDTPRNRRLGRPQYLNISFQDVVAIDFMRSVNGFGPEHAALIAYEDVWVRGERYPIPEVIEAARGPMPPSRFYPLGVEAGFGLVDPLAVAVGADRRLVEDCVSGEWIWTGEGEERAFEVDAEAAALFHGFELAEVVERARTEQLGACHAARYYLRLGTINVPKGGSARLDAMMSRTARKIASGLRWDTDPATLATVDALPVDLPAASLPAPQAVADPATLYRKWLALEHLQNRGTGSADITALQLRVQRALSRSERLLGPLDELERARARRTLAAVIEQLRDGGMPNPASEETIGFWPWILYSQGGPALPAEPMQLLLFSA